MKEDVIEEISKISAKNSQYRRFFFLKKWVVGFDCFLSEINCSSCFENVEKEENEKEDGRGKKGNGREEARGERNQWWRWCL